MAATANNALVKEDVCKRIKSPSKLKKRRVASSKLPKSHPTPPAFLTTNTAIKNINPKTSLLRKSDLPR